MTRTLRQRKWRARAAAAALLATVSIGLRAQAGAQAGTPAATGREPIRIAMVEGLSGPFANAGEAVFRNLLWATERVDVPGGVRLPGGARPLELVRLDSKGQAEESLAMLRGALDGHIAFIAQGNSSAVAAAIINALNKHNEREPGRRALLLNDSAVEPALTNERCSFWHFRFDAHADMRLAALMDVLKDDCALKKVHLVGQEYSFGKHVVRQARAMIQPRRPDIEIVGEELHPIGRVKDFLPYAAKIRASGAQAVVTGNWGNDLTLLVKAVRDSGPPLRFYTLYSNTLGVPATLGDAGVGAVQTVAEWHPHAGGTALGALAEGWMRAADHQFQQPLLVSRMERQGVPGVGFDVEGSGYGFRTLRRFEARQVELPHGCKMTRPD